MIQIGMRKVQFAENEYYHLYNRGVDKRIIFSTKDDFDRFKAYLYLLNDSDNARAANFFDSRSRSEIFSVARSQQLVAIGAYCMMPNHFHILATPLVENGISKFMQKIQTAYAMYFNEKTLRSGRLFQGTFKAKHVAEDVYLKYLYAYIHLNPAEFLKEDWDDSDGEAFRAHQNKILSYPYSSALEYSSAQFSIVDPKSFPKYFLKAKDMQSHLQFWQQYRKELARNKK